MSYLHIQRLDQIQNEYQAASRAVDYAAARWGVIHSDAIFADVHVQFAQIVQAQQNITQTYIVRVFSEFEAILREELASLGLRLPYQTEALLNRVALRRRIPTLIRLNAHSIREYRNAIVHHSIQPNAIYEFDAVMSALNRFLSGL